MKKTLLMVLLALAMGSYVWIYEIEGGEKRKAEKEQEEKVIKIEEDSIEAIIINDFETLYKFEKNNNEWVISSPVYTDADNSVISSFLDELLKARKSRSFTVKSNDKHTYGLANPMVRIKVLAVNGAEDSVQFGDKTSIGENMYIVKGLYDSTVAITPIKLKNEAQKPLLNWRNKSAINIKTDQIISFSLKTGSKSYNFEKNGSAWSITNPLNAAADNNTIRTILNKLESGRIKSVETEKAANLWKYNLSNPEYKIDLQLLNSEQKSISFSKLKNDTSFGKDESRSHVFTVDKNFIEAIDKTIYELRDKDVVDFNISSIDRVNLLFESTVLTFNKDTSDIWQITSGEPIKSEKISDLIKAVQDLKVDRFVAETPTYLSPFGLAPSKGSLELFVGDSKEVEMEFGMEKEDERYLKIKQERKVVAVKSEKMKKILINLSDILDK